MCKNTLVKQHTHLDEQFTKLRSSHELIILHTIQLIYSANNGGAYTITPLNIEGAALSSRWNLCTRKNPHPPRDVRAARREFS